MARMKFIPELKEKIIKDLQKQGLSKNTVEISLELWEVGAEPKTPWEKGCFEVFKLVQDQIESI